MYPDHICTAVNFPEGNNIAGSRLSFKNKEYIVCDPTYISSDVGMVMPQYKEVNPEVVE